MELPIKAVCEPGKMRADGTSVVFFRYNYNPTPVYFGNTEIAVPHNTGIKRKTCVSSKLPTKFGDADQLNDEIDRQFKIVREIIKWATTKNIAEKGPFLKKIFKPNFDIGNLEQLNISELTGNSPITDILSSNKRICPLKRFTNPNRLIIECMISN